MSVQGDRYSVQTLGFVDLGINEFLVKVKLYLGEDNSYQMAGFLFVEHMFQVRYVLENTGPGVQGQPSFWRSPWADNLLDVPSTQSRVSNVGL